MQEKINTPPQLVPFTEPTPEYGFKPDFEIPYSFQAYRDLQALLPTLLSKQREVVKDPGDREDLDLGWSLIRFDESVRTPLPLPSLGSDAVGLHYLTYPKTDNSDSRFDTPLFEIGLHVFQDGSPYIPEEELDRGIAENSYSVYFGPELEPFIINWADNERTLDQHLGDAIASWEGKRTLSDDECRDIVNLIATNIHTISSEIV